MSGEEDRILTASAGNVNSDVPFLQRSISNPIVGRNDVGEEHTVSFVARPGYTCVGVTALMRLTLGANINASANNTPISRILEEIEVIEAVRGGDKLAKLNTRWLGSIAALLHSASPESQAGLFGDKIFDDEDVANSNAARTAVAWYNLAMRLGNSPLEFKVKMFPIDDLFTDSSSSVLRVRLVPHYLRDERVVGPASLRYRAAYFGGAQRLEPRGLVSSLGLALKGRQSSKIASYTHGRKELTSQNIDDIEDITSLKVRGRAKQDGSSTWSGGINGIQDPTIGSDVHLSMRSVGGAPSPAIINFDSSEECTVLSAGRSVRL